MTVLADALLLAGFFLILAGAVGILRLPDFYARLHAVGKCDTLGVSLCVLGLILLAGPSLASLKMALILVFVGFANPTATHALARAARAAGLAPLVDKDEA
jgi:multicomponent Na+:H+ antiporter subunit G